MCRTAVGCADTPAPPNTTAVRDGDRLTIRCNRSEQIWYMVCLNASWHGEPINCNNGSCVFYLFCTSLCTTLTRSSGFWSRNFRVLVRVSVLLIWSPDVWMLNLCGFGFKLELRSFVHNVFDQRNYATTLTCKTIIWKLQFFTGEFYVTPEIICLVTPEYNYDVIGETWRHNY